jgi:hypothetical protein
MMSASPSLAELAKSYEITRKRSPRSIAELPSSTPEAEAFAKQLKSQGYRFVGPTSMYAFMQTSAWSTTTSTAVSGRSTTSKHLRAAEDRNAHEEAAAQLIDRDRSVGHLAPTEGRGENPADREGVKTRGKVAPPAIEPRLGGAERAQPAASGASAAHAETA